MEAQVLNVGSVYPFTLQLSNIGSSATRARATTKRVVSCAHKVVVEYWSSALFGLLTSYTAVTGTSADAVSIMADIVISSSAEEIRIILRAVMHPRVEGKR